MKKKQPKLTKWFPGDVKPKSRGFYEREWFEFGEDLGGKKQAKETTDYWNGYFWCYGDGVDKAPVARAVIQDRRWRGLAEKP